jgi:Ca2+-transporting ATPase
MTSVQTRDGAGSPAQHEAATQRWHSLDVPEALGRLGVSPGTGLSGPEADRRLGQYGRNELEERGAKSPWRILWEQLTATMVLILIAAAAIYAAVSGVRDALPIIAIVALFALLGFLQEYRAEKAMAALKKLAVPTVRVRRDGRLQELSARDLVPGDIVLLEAGNLTPADLRLVESVNLRVQEAALTGESEPVEKTADAMPDGELALGDRLNMAYMGTVVTYGRGHGVVVATGMRTELGNIAAMLQGVERETTPLGRRLDQLGRALGLVALGVGALIFVLGLLRNEDLELMILTAISTAVATVPEGLPAVVTITLAIGAQRMLRRQALIRKLPAVETLGSVTVICSDKTGTLTENRMTVTVLDVAGHRLDLSEVQSRQGRMTASPSEPGGGGPLFPAQSLLLAGGSLCNDAVLGPTGPGQQAQAIGDPTEAALVVAAGSLDLRKPELEAALPRVAELPFDSDRKRMTTVHAAPVAGAAPPPGLRPAWDALGAAGDAPYLAFTKGAVDGLLGLSSRVWSGSVTEPMDEGWRARIQASADEMARSGMRVLGVAYRPLAEPPVRPTPETLERDLVFVGLFGMIDPPRAEARDAVATCKRAGIRPVMITGDHALTALHIAKQLGIAESDRVVTGEQLERLEPGELERVAEETSVYARVSPEHKLRIVEALQRRGHVVAMTGDGVNDAPALKRADIGVAMGITGTDVSKEAAQMVLRDDNFATIVSAVEEGRTIYDNIRKFVKFSIAGNIGKIIAVVVGPLVGTPLPLLPIQLLWLNLLTDGLLGLGLGVEAAERNVMSRKPHSPTEGIFARGMGAHIVRTGLLIGVVSLGVGLWAWFSGHENWQTILFTTLAFAQVGQALAVRSDHDSLFRIGLGSNRPMTALVALVVALQLAVVYWSPLGGLFGTDPLAVVDLLICALAGVVVFAALELEKWWGRRRGATSPAASVLGG